MSSSMFAATRNMMRATARPAFAARRVVPAVRTFSGYSADLAGLSEEQAEAS